MFFALDTVIDITWLTDFVNGIYFVTITNVVRACLI